MNLLVVSRFTMNLPSFSRINYEFTLFIADSVRIHFAVIFGFANSLYVFKIPWIHCLFRESTMNFLSFPWTHCLFANILWFHYFFANWLSNNYIFSEFAMNSLSFTRIYYLSGELTMNSLGFLRSYHEFTIFFVNSPSISRKYHEFTICLAITLWIHCLFRDSTMNWLCLPGIH